MAGANQPLSQASRKARKLCINGKERAPLCGGTQLRRNLREIAAIYDDNMTSVHHGGSCKLARVRGCAQKNRICQVATAAFRCVNRFTRATDFCSLQPILGAMHM